METNASHALPTVTVSVDTLPSKGLAYPKGTMFTYTAYTYGEVQFMSSSKKMTYQDVLKKAHSGVRVTGTHMNPNDITLFDLLYLGIARKLSTLGGTEFEIQSICESKKCNKQYTRQFSAKDIKFKDIEVESLPIEIDLNSGVTLALSPITIGDFYELCEGGMFYKALNAREPLYDNAIAMKAAQVRNMKFIEAYNTIKNITDADDSELMDELDQILIHNIEPLEHICEACDRVNKLQLEGKESLIRPFRSGKANVRDRIRYGKRNAPVTVAPETNGIHGSNAVEQSPNGEA